MINPTAVAELVIQYRSAKKQRDKIEFYNKLIGWCEFGLNPCANVSMSYNRFTITLLIMLILICTSTIYIILNGSLWGYALAVQITLTVACAVLSIYVKRKKMMLNKDDDVKEILSEIYESGPTTKWLEFKNYLIMRHSFEAIGRPIANKLVPYLATSLTISIAYKLIDYSEPGSKVEYLISALLIITFIFYFVKINNFRNIDKLEYLIKMTSEFEGDHIL